MLVPSMLQEIFKPFMNREGQLMSLRLLKEPLISAGTKHACSGGSAKPSKKCASEKQSALSLS